MKKNPKSSKIDQAFQQSDKHTLADLKLNAWSPERMIKAQELGMVYPALSSEAWAQFKKTGVYPGAPKDAMLFVYISQMPDEDIRDRDGKLVEPSFDSATYAQARAFGIRRNLHLTDRKEFWDAHLALLRAYEEIRAAATKPVQARGSSNEEEEEEGND